MGSPLFQNERLVGLQIFSVETINKPILYASLSKILPNIDNIIEALRMKHSIKDHTKIVPTTFDAK